MPTNADFPMTTHFDVSKFYELCNVKKKRKHFLWTLNKNEHIQPRLTVTFEFFLLSRISHAHTMLALRFLLQTRFYFIHQRGKDMLWMFENNLLMKKIADKKYKKNQLRKVSASEDCFYTIFPCLILICIRKCSYFFNAWHSFERKKKQAKKVVCIFKKTYFKI